MGRIHFCGEEDHPLCGRGEGDAWLWTVSPEAVTCPDCAGALELAGSAYEAPDVEPRYVLGVPAGESLPRG
jgi:hypothetical protein